MVDRLAELGALQYAAANTATASVNPSRIAASGYIHAMYAEYVTWSLANPGVNPSRLSAKGRIFGYFYDNATFSPLSLFSSGEQGAWYDPSDLTTMFQDSAGTTPVTADGQPVGKILDKSGRGNHATQATAAKRPLLQNDGVNNYLAFDGVDDALATANIDFTSTDKMNVFSGCRVVGTTNQMSFSSGPSGNGRGDILFLSGASPVARATLVSGSGGVSQLTTPSPGASPVSIVNSVLFDIAGATTSDEIKLRQNGVLGTQNVITGPAGTGNFGNYQIALGDTNGAGAVFPFNGRIYSLIVLGRLATTQEITDTETWVNSKTGAY